MRLVAGAWCGPIKRMDLKQKTWTDLSAEATPLSSETNLHVALSDDCLYSVTPEHLRRRDAQGRWSSRRIPDHAAPENVVRCVAAHPAGKQVWIGTHKGLRVLADWETDTWVVYRRCGDRAAVVASVWRAGEEIFSQVLSRGFADEEIRCIAFDGNDALVGCAAGLVRATGHGYYAGLRDVPDRPTTPARACAPPAPRETTCAPIPPGGKVMIGIMGPSAPPVALAGGEPGAPLFRNRPDMQAVQLAVMEANDRGGYRSEAEFTINSGPHGYLQYGWGTHEDDFRNFGIDERVFGMVGNLRPNSRIASGVSIHWDVPMMNVNPLEPTVDESLSPWMFRFIGDEPKQDEAGGRVLARGAWRSKGGGCADGRCLSTNAAG